MKVLWVAVCVGFVLRILFLLMAPLEGKVVTARLSAYNDELAHFNYIQHIVEYGELPGRGSSIKESATATFENFQPPLYYLLCAPVVALWQRVDFGTGFVAARMVSLMAGMALIPLAFWIVRQLGLGEAAAVGAAIVTSVLGSFVRFSSLVSSDALSWLLGGLAILFWFKAEEDPSIGRYLFLWCLAIIAGLFAKLSLLLLLPLPILACLVQRRWKQCLYWFSWTVVAVLATLPLWIRNVRSFGSLLPLEAGFGEPDAGAPSMRHAWAYAARSLFFPWQEFWGGWAGGLLVLCVILACIFLLISSVMRRKDLRFPVPCALLLLSSLGAFVGLNLHYFQAEGRYLLVTWPVWVALLGVGGTSAVRQWVLLGALLIPYLLFFIPFLQEAHV